MNKANARITLDVSTAISQGNREYQEDAIAVDFQNGGRVGFVVLADGMGGHAAGDIASNMVLTEVFSELKLESDMFLTSNYDFATTLKSAVEAANQGIQHYVETHPSAKGMGSTLLSAVIVDNGLYWISIGDSPLYLIRDRKLRQLNADHSMAPQIDFMVAEGEMTEEEGRLHPDRNCLTSAVTGSPIPKIDCPTSPFRLEPGDCVVCSSDGIQFLDDPAINRVISKCSHKSSAHAAEAILEAIEEIDHPDQDNISFAIINVGLSEADSEVKELQLVQNEPTHECLNT